MVAHLQSKIQVNVAQVVSQEGPLVFVKAMSCSWIADPEPGDLRRLQRFV